MASGRFTGLVQIVDRNGLFREVRASHGLFLDYLMHRFKLKSRFNSGFGDFLFNLKDGCRNLHPRRQTDCGEDYGQRTDCEDIFSLGNTRPLSQVELFDLVASFPSQWSADMEPKPSIYSCELCRDFVVI